MYFSQHEQEEPVVEGEYDFLRDDWRSAIDTTQEEWFSTAFDQYLVHIFPESYEGVINGACDTDEICFTINEDQDEVCINVEGEDYGCYSPEVALDMYFYGSTAHID